MIDNIIKTIIINEEDGSIQTVSDKEPSVLLVGEDGSRQDAPEEPEKTEESAELLELEEAEENESFAKEAPAEENALTGSVEVVDVRFKAGGKVYYFDPRGLAVRAGQNVIIETSRGIEYGECTQGNHTTDAAHIVPPLRPVIRIATEKDDETLESNRAKEKKAFEICQQKITELNLDMKLIDVEYSFDGSKILFFFTSDGRVDFRELVKNLASVFRTRIELRQIGVRDEAKMLGGLGICGRPFCCKQFLDDFHPVSIKMAKTQNLSLNPTKISGTCGRLMCCLKYEQEAYEDMHKRTPKVESYVETPLGKGVITDVNLLRATVKVTLDDEPDTSHTYKVHEITVLHNGSRNKKSTPLLPPDPPVVMDEFDETEYPEIVYSDPAEKTMDGAQTEEKNGGEKKSNRRRNKNKKKSSAQQQKKQPETEQKKQDNTPKGDQKKSDGKKPEQQKKSENRKPEQKKNQGQKPEQKKQVKPEQKSEQKPENKAEGKTENKKNNNKNRYYRNRRKKSGSNSGANKANAE
ncbi:MAG: hypothetical protein E7430_05355 [Ruminococcaceae bacterium]|nr:hypothetical protein [Oscillospiraceae bacterium]